MRSPAKTTSKPIQAIIPITKAKKSVKPQRRTTTHSSSQAERKIQQLQAKLKKALQRNKEILQQKDLTNNYLDTLFAHMPGNIYWMDKNSIYLGCNENAAKTCGFKSRKDIVGKTYLDFAKMANWNKGQGESFRTDDKRVIETGLPIFNKEEPPIPDATGKMICFLTTRVPLCDRAGNIVGVVGVSIDITERKKMEQELKEAKERAEAALRAKELAEMESREKTVIIEDMLQDLTMDSYCLTDEKETFKLSHRETQCMFCLVHGKSAKQTAKVLQLSFRTIEFYLARLKNKLRCKSRSDLIAKAMSCRFLEGIYAGLSVKSASQSQTNKVSNKEG